MAFFSNSSDGGILDRQCGECIHQDPDAGCPVARVQTEFNYDQIDNDKLVRVLEILINKKGVCQLKPLIEKYYRKRPWPGPEKQQMDLFKQGD